MSVVKDSLILLSLLLLAGTPVFSQQASTAPTHVSLERFKHLLPGIPQRMIAKLYSAYEASIADPMFKLGEVYAFPNHPAKSQNSTLHIEVGAADSVEIKIYVFSWGPPGSLRKSIVLKGPPILIDRGKGLRYAYEYIWDVSGESEGPYRYVVTAKKAGRADIQTFGTIYISP